MAYIASFFEIYEGKVKDIQGGVYALAKRGGLADEIVDYVKSELGNRFTDELEPLIRDYAEKSWNEGAVIGAIKTGVVSDSRAVDWFAKTGKYDFGKVFGEYSDAMRRAVNDALAGRAADDADTIAAVAKKTVGQELNSEAIRSHYNLVVSNAVNKSRNYARTLAYEEIGIHELEIVAMVDGKTSDFCREMDGRRISVRTAADFVRDAMATPAESVVKKFPWPKEVPFGKTSDIVSGLSCKLPPYHARCRTTTVVGRSERVVTRSNRQLSDIERPKESTTRKYLDTLRNQDDRARKRENIQNACDLVDRKYGDLTSDELSSKVNALRGSSWFAYEGPKGVMVDGLESHWRANDRRKRQFRDLFGDNFSERDYIKKSMEGCKKFDRVFLQFYTGRTRVMFYDSQTRMTTIVDADTGRIATCYILDDAAEPDVEFGGRFHELK